MKKQPKEAGLLQLPKETTLNIEILNKFGIMIVHVLLYYFKLF